MSNGIICQNCGAVDAVPYEVGRPENHYCKKCYYNERRVRWIHPTCKNEFKIDPREAGRYYWMGEYEACLHLCDLNMSTCPDFARQQELHQAAYEAQTSGKNINKRGPKGP